MMPRSTASHTMLSRICLSILKLPFPLPGASGPCVSFCKMLAPITDGAGGAGRRFPNGKRPSGRRARRRRAMSRISKHGVEAVRHPLARPEHPGALGRDPVDAGEVQPQHSSPRETPIPQGRARGRAPSYVCICAGMRMRKRADVRTRICIPVRTSARKPADERCEVRIERATGPAPRGRR